MEKSSTTVVRKGAWMKEEDDLLRDCIKKYGEGKWHLVPQRAGLKRCRKSCRLRWLNYLKPTIKRGDFEADEVDLIIRLHRLLGNRWSLIAGRLPGRTPNDVKNFCHTHLRKLLITGEDHNQRKLKGPDLQMNQVTIKPHPTTLSAKNLPLATGTPSCEVEDCLNTSMDFATNSSSTLSTPENWTEWFTSLMDLEDKGENDKMSSTCFVNIHHTVDKFNDFWDEDMDEDISFKNLSCWNDLSFDVNGWVGMEQYLDS